MVEKILPLSVNPRFFFTEPWEPLIVRRGDALGLSALLDQFADAVAPDFSNRIRDGRWVTILAWCLVQSQQIFHASGGRSVNTRKEQNERYAWLRPLELMWVARTITLLEKEDWKQRSLAGQRRVAPWINKQSIVRFGMSPEQFRAYRQTGTYGGYRRAFRKWPGMTAGDGWTPGPKTMALAKWLDAKLKGAQLKFGDDLGRSAKTGRGKECSWWLNHWKEFAQSGKDAEVNTLPRQKNDFTVLPEAEILKPIIFGDDPRGQKRVKVVRAIQKSVATNHLELCQYLSIQFKDDPIIARLYSFSRLADAGMAAMDVIAEVLRDKPDIALKDAAQHKNAVSVCKELLAAAQAWSKVPAMQMRHIETAHRFADAITTDQPIECFRVLLRHHETYGGGLRWFVLRNGRVEARTPPTNSASRYGFRLWSLCRLATQCGVLKTMPKALLDELANLDDEYDE
jgi:hypothetical protein